MQIKVIYDDDVAKAPAGFKTAVAEAVSFLDQLITNNITVTIEFGWGQAGPLDGNVSHAAAESLPAWEYIPSPSATTTAALTSALIKAYSANGLSTFITPQTLSSVIATLPASSDLAIGYAQAQALNLNTGMLSSSTNISYVALNSNDTWNWDVNQAPSATSLDAVAAIIHEITHDFGRTTGWTDSNGLKVESLLDIFRYSAVGVSQATEPGGGYFSLDGKTLLKPFASAATDPADWVISQQIDANGPAIIGNSAYFFSSLDELELEALGFKLATPSTYPILTITGSAGNQTAVGSATPFKGLTISDPNPDSLETVVIQASHTGYLTGFAGPGGQPALSSDTYTLSGTAASVTKAIQSATFAAGVSLQSPVKVDFTLSVTNSAGQQTSNSAISLELYAPPMTPTIIGNSGADSLAGHNAVFWGGPGNDTIAATGNANVSLYEGLSSQYKITQLNGKITVSDQVAGRDGTDTLTGVQRLAFHDEVLAFDVDGHAGQAYRMFQAAFGRAPDQAGVSFWTHQLDVGLSLTDMAKDFVNSAEFAHLYGSRSGDQSLVTTLYSNILGRKADDSGLDYWSSQLRAGEDVASLLMSFSESPENVALALPAIKNGIALDLSLFV